MWQLDMAIRHIVRTDIKQYLSCPTKQNITSWDNS